MQQEEEEEEGRLSDKLVPNLVPEALSDFSSGSLNPQSDHTTPEPDQPAEQQQSTVAVASRAGGDGKLLQPTGSTTAAPTPSPRPERGAHFRPVDRFYALMAQLMPRLGADFTSSTASAKDAQAARNRRNWTADMLNTAFAQLKTEVPTRLIAKWVCGKSWYLGVEQETAFRTLVGEAQLRVTFAWPS